MREFVLLCAAGARAAACPVLSRADARAAAGEPLVERLVSRENRALRCLFSGETRTLSVTISDYESDSGAFERWRQAQRSTLSEPERFGDGGYSVSDPEERKVTLCVVKGRRIYEIWLKGADDDMALARLRLVMRKWTGKP
jgi:hypothetical protein